MRSFNLSEAYFTLEDKFRTRETTLDSISGNFQKFRPAEVLQSYLGQLGPPAAEALRDELSDLLPCIYHNVKLQSTQAQVSDSISTNQTS